jgi:hypothetical protein
MLNNIMTSKCNICNYQTTIKSNYNEHIKTEKHKHKIQ